MDNQDKPIKIVFENNPIKINTDFRLPNNQEIREQIRYVLISMRFFKPYPITTQQYRSEMGKIRRYEFGEVLNFIKKRNEPHYEELNKYINTEQNFYSCSITKRFNVNVVSRYFGIINQ